MVASPAAKAAQAALITQATQHWLILYTVDPTVWPGDRSTFGELQRDVFQAHGLGVLPLHAAGLSWLV